MEKRSREQIRKDGEKLKRLEFLEDIWKNAYERQIAEIRTVTDNLKTTQSVILSVNSEEELYYEILSLIAKRVRMLKRELGVMEVSNESEVQSVT